jgi:hypothetical protein
MLSDSLIRVAPIDNHNHPRNSSARLKQLYSSAPEHLKATSARSFVAWFRKTKLHRLKKVRFFGVSQSCVEPAPPGVRPYTWTVQLERRIVFEGSIYEGTTFLSAVRHGTTH